MVEQYKFQKLQVYQLALKYVDAVYALSRKLPQQERFNLSSQIERAATSIVLEYRRRFHWTIESRAKSVLGPGLTLVSGNGRLSGFDRVSWICEC